MPVLTTDLQLFRQIFFLRQDVHAEMFKRKTGERAGETGYSPACSLRWDVTLCNHGKCRQCQNFAGVALTDERIMAHLKGSKTLGTYLVSPQGMVNLCVLDVDIDKAKTEHIETYRERVKELTRQLDRAAQHHGLDVYIEDSGNKGYHLWAFFAAAIPASRAQALGNWLAAQTEEFEGLHVEVFPKQDAIDQYGNLVKVPLGVHLKTGRRCLFVDPETLEGRNEDQLEILRSIKTVSLDTIEFLFNEHDIMPPAPIRAPGKNGSGTGSKSGLPCVARMYNGVSEGCRDEVAFRLAVHHFKQGRPKELAELDLCRWDADHNDPPLGEAGVLDKAASAYSGKYGYGCSSPLIEPFCDASCPIFKKRQEPEPIVEEEVRTSTELRFLKIDPADSTMIFCRAGLEYRCAGIEVEKAGVKATVELREGQTVIYKDRLGLAMANRRKGFAKESVAHKPELLYESIVNDLTQLEDLIKLKEQEVFTALEAEKGAQYVMSAEEETRALELLRSPRLLWQVKCMLDRIGVVGEDTNKLVIYLGYTSRLLPEPIQILVKGESSSGKSYVTRKTLTLFPTESYTELTDMTPQALFYIKEKDLRHHILLVFEKHGGEKADYTIRTTQSEGVLRIWVVTKDKETMEMTTKEVTVEGPVMFLLTTTDAQIHAENETRNISLFSDDSKDQTRAIRSMAVKQYMLETEEINIDEILIWHNAQRLLKTYQVRIPYIREIDKSFPLEPVRVRRDFHRFIALIKTVALLHQYQRTITEVKGTPTIDATVSDYYIAKKLAEKVFAQAIMELGPKSIEVWRHCYINKHSPDDIGLTIFTYASVAEGLGWKTVTVKKWAYPLAEAGYVRWVHEDNSAGKNKGGKGRQARFELTDKDYGDMNVLPHPDELITKYPTLSSEIYDPLTGETPDDVLPF